MIDSYEKFRARVLAADEQFDNREVADQIRFKHPFFKPWVKSTKSRILVTDRDIEIQISVLELRSMALNSRYMTAVAAFMGNLIHQNVRFSHYTYYPDFVGFAFIRG